MPVISRWSTSDVIAALSLVMLFITIISPAIIAFIQRRTELKSKMIDVYKENYSKKYNRQYYIFQDFIEHSGKIIAKIGTENTPSNEELQKFESACLKCLIFLEGSDRREFDNFRISVKTKLGYKDPRGELTIFDIASQITNAAAILSLAKRKNVDDVYTAFNACIKISSEKLATIEEEEQVQLRSILITCSQRLHRLLKWTGRKLLSLSQLLLSRLYKIFRSKT